MFVQFRWLRCSIIALVLCVLVVGPIEAASPYFVVDLGSLNPGAAGNSYASAINYHGQVVGTAWNGAAYEAFVWNGIAMAGLGTLAADGSGWSHAADINNVGHVVGTSWNGTYSEALLWNGTTMLGLGVFHASPFLLPDSSASAINDNGRVVGTSNGVSAPFAAFLWQDGTMYPLYPVASNDSRALGINNQTHVVGMQFGLGRPWAGFGPFLWVDTTMTHLGLPALYTLSEGYATGVNDTDRVVGIVGYQSDNPQAVLWDQGVPELLGFDGGSQSNRVAVSINNRGQVVGSDTNRGGVLWDGSVQYLSDLLDERGAGWTIEWAVDINDRGQIAATALGPDGYFHAVRLDPTTLLSIDIKPGDNPNTINRKSKGKVPAALLSTPAFNAFTQIDQVSLTFGRSGDEASLAFCDFAPVDVNGDGWTDLVCHFYTEATGFRAGDRVGLMKGKTLSSVSMTGSDSVRIVPPK